MTRTFIEVPLFSKRWKEIGLGEDELQALQIMLLKDPEAGPVMEGTGGIRKVRFPINNRGKSGSVRVCYTDFAEYEVIYLITAFEKKDQENLSDDEKRAVINGTHNVQTKKEMQEYVDELTKSAKL